MSTLTTFIQLSFGSPIQIHQAIKRNSRHPNLKGRGKTDTICRLKSESVSHSVVSDSSQPQGLQPDRLLCPLGFSRQEYWSGLPFLPPGDLPNPVTKPTFLTSPALVGGFFTTSTTWEAQCCFIGPYHLAQDLRIGEEWPIIYSFLF